MRVKATFITGNINKAKYLEKYLGIPVDHQKVDLEEIQSMDLKKIVEHKVKQAFSIIQKPVIVEDVALEFEELGGLPGPFIRYFLENLDQEKICSLVDRNRNATARCVIGYFDGVDLELFESNLKGKVAISPKGENGYGWDRIFIPEGYDKTRAELDEIDDQITYLKIKPLAKLKKLLLN